MKFTTLAENPHFILPIANWFHKEWAHLNPDRTLEDVIKLIEKNLNTNTLPIIYVAFDEKSVYGTISLRKSDMTDSNQDKSPWISSLFVDKNFRNKGIGKFLISNCKDTAKELGFGEIYLFTEDHKAWYEKLGWSTLEETTERNFPVSVMKKTI